MALKHKITKAEFDALAAALQVEYVAKGDAYELDVTGIDDPAELRRAKDREVEARKVAEAARKLAQDKLDAIVNDDAHKAGDIKTLEASWKSKLDIETAKLQKTIDSQTAFIKGTLVDSIATSIATELSGDNAVVMLPHIKARLTADLDSETPTTRVLDKDGKVSALTVADLKKEIAEDKRFSSVVVASHASGGGAAGGNNNNSGGAGSGKKKFKELNDAERTEWFKRDPKGFEEAAQADRRVF